MRFLFVFLFFVLLVHGLLPPVPLHSKAGKHFISSRMLHYVNCTCITPFVSHNAHRPGYLGPIDSQAITKREILLRAQHNLINIQHKPSCKNACMRRGKVSKQDAQHKCKSAAATCLTAQQRILFFPSSRHPAAVIPLS